jgi:adenosylcobinamide-GDP ribazoletransferase
MFLISVGIWSEMPIDGIFVIAFGYIISRALYGISVLTLKHAPSKSGKIENYVPEKSSAKWMQVIINAAYILASAALMIKIAGTFSVPRPSVAVASLIGAALTFVFYAVITYKNFGGVTEESGGFFVVLCEVIIPIAALAVFKSPI